jgi:hypothetical protein
MVKLNESPGPAARPWTVLEIKGPPPPLDAEFKGGQAAEVFCAGGLALGRCFGSKSGYREKHRRNYFIPNANVCAIQDGKLWWGDLDLYRDSAALEQVAGRLRRRLYVLEESAARFEQAGVQGEEVRRRARWCTGGRIPVLGLTSFLRKSGLTLTQAALLLGRSRQRLRRRLRPEVALELNRDIRALDSWYSLFTKGRPRLKWGQWLLTPNRRLGGARPFDLVLQGRSAELRALLPGPRRR